MKNFSVKPLIYVYKFLYFKNYKESIVNSSKKCQKLNSNFDKLKSDYKNQKELNMELKKENTKCQSLINKLSELSTDENISYFSKNGNQNAKLSGTTSILDYNLNHEIKESLPILIKNNSLLSLCANILEHF